MSLRSAAIVVMAKPPTVAKSRLRAECGSTVGGRLAEAMLLDTLDAVAASSAARRVVAVAGAPGDPRGDWVPAGFDAIAQRGSDLAARLQGAFEDVAMPAVAIAIDTPQVTWRLLDLAIDELLRDGTGAVIGPAIDGGYWAIGLRHARDDVFAGVAMCTPNTARDQQARFRELGLGVRVLPTLRDIDVLADARVVAAEVPTSRLAATLLAHQSEVA